MKRAVPATLLFLSLFAPAFSSGQARTLEQLLDGARAAQEAGDYGAAAGFFKQATTLSPKTAELWSNRGVMEYLAHETDASALSLRHALRLNPDLVAPLLFLGRGAIDRGQPASALPYLIHAHALQPDDVEILLTTGKADTLLGHQRDAAAVYMQAAHAAPNDPAPWLGLGTAALEVVADDGRSLSAGASQSTWARSLYADELLAQGRPLEATDVYEAALAGATPEQRAVLARTLQLIESKPELFALPAPSQQVVAKLSAQLAPAVSGSTACTADEETAQPSRPKIRNVLAAACDFWAGEYDRSAVEATLVLQQQPANEEALYWSIKANERIAVAALSRVDEIAPSSVIMHVLVGDLYRDQRQPDSAIAEYAKALAIDPHDASARLGITASYLAANQLEDATASAKRALADRPLDPQLNLLMAEILGAAGHENEARPFLARCTAIAPEFQARVHYLLARAAMADGDTGEAIRQFELALPADEDGKTHYQLSRLYRKTGETAKAQKAEAEAKELVAKRDAKAAIVVREATAPSP